MRAVENADEFYERIRNGRSLVAAFRADWCGDCHFLRPSYPEIEQRFAGRLDFVAVDTETLPDLARNHEISGIPSFILFFIGARGLPASSIPAAKPRKKSPIFSGKRVWPLIPDKEFS